MTLRALLILQRLHGQRMIDDAVKQVRLFRGLDADEMHLAETEVRATLTAELERRIAEAEAVYGDAPRPEGQAIH